MLRMSRVSRDDRLGMVFSAERPAKAPLFENGKYVALKTRKAIDEVDMHHDDAVEVCGSLVG